MCSINEIDIAQDYFSLKVQYLLGFGRTQSKGRARNNLDILHRGFSILRRPTSHIHVVVRRPIFSIHGVVILSSSLNVLHS